jgi:uncharacterized protein (TIGR03437 family)
MSEAEPNILMPARPRKLPAVAKVHAAVALFLMTAAWIHAATPPSLSYLDVGAGGSACCLLSDSSGNIYVVMTSVQDGYTYLEVAWVQKTGPLEYRFKLGEGSIQPQAAAMDGNGNIIIAGQANPSGFVAQGSSGVYLAGPLIPQTEPGAPAGFVVKVNASSGMVFFATLLGGQAAELGTPVGTNAHAVAVDAAGNIYVGGETNAKDFPVTANAFQQTAPGGSYGFVMKISSLGDEILYSTLLGGETVNCNGGSHCIGIATTTAVRAIAVDQNGLATVAGGTNATDFPVTAGAPQTTCHCLEYAGNGFVTRLNADASAVVWSTFLGGSPYGGSQYPYGVNTVAALALDASGNALVAGKTDATDFPVTAGAFEAQFAGPAAALPRTTDGFLAKVASAGTSLIFSTYLGGSAADEIDAISIDAQGNLWAVGLSASADLPGAAEPFVGSFYVELPADGSKLLTSQRTPGHASGQTIHVASDGTLWVLGAQGSVLQIPGEQVQGFAVLGSASAAGLDVKGYVAPGECLSLYGNLPGPTAGASFTLDSNGRIATTLAGVQVLFMGYLPAPLLYVSAGQINFLAPYELAGLSTATFQVTSAAGNSQTFELNVEAAQPEVFTSGGMAVALNQDGSFNSAANPAAGGSTVTIWASGAGALNPQPPDGAIAGNAVWLPVLPVAVLQDSLSIEVDSARPAPGWPAGVLEIVLRLPQQPVGILQLMMGDYLSDPFQIAVQ